MIHSLRSSTSLQILITGLSVLALSCAVTRAQTISVVPIFPGGSNSAVYAVNSNGTAAAGYSNNAAGTDTGLRWVNPGGSGNMGFLPGGGLNSYAQAIDGTGTILAGYGDSAGNTRAFRATTSFGFEVLPVAPGTNTFGRAQCISVNGSRVAGVSGTGLQARAFLWDAASPATSSNLGLLAGQTTSGAVGISGDGTTVVGSSGTLAFRWTAGSGMVGLGAPLPGQVWAIGEAVNTNGTVITGRYSTGSELGYRWTAATGMVALPLSPGGSFALRPRAINGDGTLIIGQVVDGVAGFTAFVWTPTMGTQILSNHLAARGVNMAGWQLTDATGISADGTAMCGVGIFGGQSVGWVVKNLPCATVNGIGYGGPLCVGTSGWTIANVTAVVPGAVYRWEKNGFAIVDGAQPSGSTLTGTATNTITFSNIQPGDAGNYTLFMSSQGACESSFTAVNYPGPQAAITITTQPTANSACQGQNPGLFCTGFTPITGTVQYRWQKFVGGNWIDLADGATGNGGSFFGTGATTFSIFNAQPADTGQYRCRLTNSVCTSASSQFSNAVPFTIVGSPTVTGPANSYQCPGDNDAFISVTATPAAGCTYRWQKYVGPSINSYVDIFDGATGNGGNYGQTGTATLGIYGFYAGDFNLYRCRVTGPCGPSVTSNSALLTGFPAAAVLSGPSDTSVCQGDNDAFFTVTGTVGAGYQWQKFVGPSPTAYVNIFNGPTGNGGNYGGTNSPGFGVYGCYPADFIRYRCVVIDPCGGPSVISPSALLSPSPAPTIVSGPGSASACPFANASLTVAVTPGGCSYQWQKYVGPCILCWQNISNGPTGNGGTFAGALSATLTINGLNILDTVTTYRCIVTDPCGISTTASGPGTFTLMDTPSLQTQPVGGPVCRDGTKTVTVAVAPGNYGTLTYQWWRYVPAFPIYAPVPNGALPSTAVVSGALTPSITISNFKPQDAGQYYCRVTGDCGNVLSSVASLTSCFADFNCSGATNVQDIFDFLAAWFAGNPNANFNGVGGINIQDIFDFLAAWFVGC